MTVQTTGSRLVQSTVSERASYNLKTMAISLLRQPVKYSTGAYLKSLSDRTGKEILCVLPVTVELVKELRIQRRRGLINWLMQSINSALGWDHRVFVAAKTEDGKTMLLLLHTHTAEDSLEYLKTLQANRTENQDMDLSNLDTVFSTAYGTSMLYLEDAHLKMLDASSFEVTPTQQTHVLRNIKYVFTIETPSESASEEERASFNDSGTWLSSITAGRAN